MKIHVKRYGNEGHDITTAEELKVALESFGGIQDTHVYTAEIDFDCQNMNKCSIPEINLYNNFQFEETGIRMWLGYNIGEGKFIPYKTIHGTANSQQGDTNLVILEHPKGTKRRCDSCPRKRKYKDTLQKQEEEAVDEVDDYTCGECGITFNSLKDYNLHQDLGNHKIKRSCQNDLVN
ncbi:uncharacterized protein LOC134256359 [Saccostrea cucullata]|uniref:uncharacterized protein LOC134256359 n=1 Tax=Saccostrea cuccullata TaxID=36930 RepID=UPI002ED31486